MNTRNVKYYCIIMIAAQLVSSCSRKEGEHEGDKSAKKRDYSVISLAGAPPTAAGGNDGAGHENVNEGKIRNNIKSLALGALKLHGHFSGEIYESIRGNEYVIQYNNLRPLIAFNEVTAADRLNGYTWSVELSFAASAIRTRKLNDREFSKWTDGMGFFGLPDFQINEIKGKIYYQSNSSYKWRSTMDAEKAFRTRLSDFVRSSTSADDRKNYYAIIKVLDLDEDASGKFIPQGRSKHDIVSGEMSKIELSQCPSEFMRAYQKHIEAWRSTEQKQIESTWDDVERISEKYSSKVLR